MLWKIYWLKLKKLLIKNQNNFNNKLKKYIEVNIGLKNFIGLLQVKIFQLLPEEIKNKMKLLLKNIWKKMILFFIHLNRVLLLLY